MGEPDYLYKAEWQLDGIFYSAHFVCRTSKEGLYKTVVRSIPSEAEHITLTFIGDVNVVS